jgi:acetyltransferase-like isoleucine patch superfamily enzyme
MIDDTSKRVIPFRAHDARRVGEDCFFLDRIVWLNGEHIELGDRVGFNVDCYVNGYGGLVIGDDTIVGPHAMIHTANHEMAPDRPVHEQGWTSRPVRIGRDCWIGMGVCILPGVTLGDGCVVGAGAVVTKPVEAGMIVAGNPAAPIRPR